MCLVQAIRDILHDSAGALKRTSEEMPAFFRKVGHKCRAGMGVRAGCRQLNPACAKHLSGIGYHTILETMSQHPLDLANSYRFSSP